MPPSSPAIRLLLPRSLAPLVLTCEHASRRLPSSMPLDRASRAILPTHWGWDIGAWDVVRVVSQRRKASAIGGSVTRLVIDLNRGAGEPSLVVPAAGGVALPWNASCSAREVERRIEAYHVPYHAAIDALVSRRLVRGIRPFLLAIHSFTPELHGKPRRFDAGVLFVDHGAAARRLGAALRREGLSVRYNEPYSGLEGLMYSIHRHGTHHRLPCLELEINQRLLGTAAGRRSVGEAVARAVAPLSP